MPDFQRGFNLFISRSPDINQKSITWKELSLIVDRIIQWQGCDHFHVDMPSMGQSCSHDFSRITCPRITSSESLQSHRAAGSGTEGKEQSWDAEIWVHSALTPNPLGHSLPEPCSFVGAPWDLAAPLFSPLCPLRADPPGQGCPWNPPLGAAILPAMDFPAGKTGKGRQQLPRVAGGNCSSYGSPKCAFFFKASC